PLLETELQRLRAGREAYQARFETWLAGYKPPSPEELRRIERTRVRQEVAELAARLGRPLTPAKYDVLADRYLEDVEYPVSGEPAAGARAEQDQGETVNQAAEHWFAEMQRPDAGVRSQTLDGHRLRVRAFVEHCGDVPLASVTRAMASDFLTATAKG